MQSRTAVIASRLALATALAWFADSPASIAKPASIPIPRPRPVLTAAAEAPAVNPVALHSKLPAHVPAVPAADLDAVKRAPQVVRRGRFALARALLAQGDRAAAQAYVQEAWRYDGFSEDLENEALHAFGELLTRADPVARMDDRLSAQDIEGGMRAARRLGTVETA